MTRSRALPLRVFAFLISAVIAFSQSLEQLPGLVGLVAGGNQVDHLLGVLLAFSGRAAEKVLAIRRYEKALFDRPASRRWPRS